jgi:hypothetical protein
MTLVPQGKNSILVKTVLPAILKGKYKRAYGLESGPFHARNWATGQGKSPNLEYRLSQIQANTWLARACTAISSAYLVTAQF